MFSKKQKDYDEMREGLLKEMGFIIIRFKNRESANCC